MVNAIHFNYRNYPLVQQMHAMVKSGQLGRLFLLHGSYLQDWLIKDTDYNWRVEVAAGGESRAVGDIGSHWFDTVQFITGDPVVEVMADLNIVHPRRRGRRWGPRLQATASPATSTTTAPGASLASTVPTTPAHGAMLLDPLGTSTGARRRPSRG